MSQIDVEPSRSSSFSTTPTIHTPNISAGGSLALLPPQARLPQPASGRPENGSVRSPSDPRRPSTSSGLTPTMASKQSSSTLYQSAVGSQQDLRQHVRSAYPPGVPQNHVEFILVASFDIDRGSIMEHQYPGPISGDEHMLAELMLPEGTHNRSQDWTIFFLHKDPEQDEPPDTPGPGEKPVTPRHEDGESSTNTMAVDDDDDALEGPPLVYVLNLVNTKHDSNVKRGAVVKAMAICTRHPFLHIYKPLLLLALEEYFRAPTPETLISLYEAVNAMDLSLMPRLSTLERIILQSSTAKDLFAGKFKALLESSVQQGHPPTMLSKTSIPRDTHEFESRIVYNGISVPVKVPTARAVETVGDFSIIKLIQTFSNPHLANPQPFALHPHLTTGGAYTHPIVVLTNALVTQKRIIFLGHNQPSGDVAEAVLAACALASGGILRGFTRHAFPYTDLTKIDDLLKVPGFIAGVTNPAFANKPEWWDLICDLSTGRMKISNRIDPAPVTEGINAFQQQNPGAASLLTGMPNDKGQDLTGDAAFMDEVLRNITNRLGEAVIRSMWRDWVIKLTRMAAAFEEMVYGASALYIGGDQADVQQHGLSGHGYVWPSDNVRQRELAGNLYRIEGWRTTRSYYSYKRDQIHLWNSRPIKEVDLHHHHDRLRSQKLSAEESAAIYLGFSAMIETEAEINQLLTVTSESHGGIWYISLGLFHPRKIVQFNTVELLDRIQDHEAGKHFWEKLSRFSKLAYFRIKGEKEGPGSSAGARDNGKLSTLSPLSQTSAT